MNLYQDVFFSALDVLRGRQNMRRLRFLRESQYWPPEQLRSWQLARLNELLAQARLASDFHRQRLAEVHLPLRDHREIEQIPILTKQDIRDNIDSIKADNLPPSRFVASRTGGSTGRPMSFYWDKQAMDWNRGTVYRSVEWAGAALGEPTVEMSGSQFDEAQARRLLNRVSAWVHRHRQCSVAWVTDEIHEEYFRVISRFRPTSIWGYSSGIDLFARHIEAHHPDAKFPYLRALITSSEMLRPEQRRQIERVFGNGKVFDNYGSREMYMAAECRAHDGYHLHSDVVLTEVVRPDGSACAPGERGRVILTELFNHAFPFVRYEIGDLAVMDDAEECSCGVRLPRLRSIEGRVAELVVLRDRILTPPNFASIFSDMDEVLAYQIVQKTIDEIQVLVEPGEGFSSEDQALIGRSVRKIVAGQARVLVTTDQPIEIPESGKRRFVVSAVREADRAASAPHRDEP